MKLPNRAILCSATAKQIVPLSEHAGRPLWHSAFRFKSTRVVAKIQCRAENRVGLQ